MNKMPANIKAGWWSIEIPEYRPHLKLFSTYSLFPYDDLPPIDQELDDDFHWLKSQPRRKGSLIEGCHNDGSQSDLSKLPKIASEFDIKLPRSFKVFMASLLLHKRIRSCTDCYLDVADRAIKTAGTIDGHLIHFLSDSQWVLHWYIHIDSSGDHFVAVSSNAYGFAPEDPDEDPIALQRKNEVDLQEEEIWFCAPTFNEFIYRFWLENEIWFALELDDRPLTAIEQAYVGYYSNKTKLNT